MEHHPINIVLLLDPHSIHRIENKVFENNRLQPNEHGTESATQQSSS